MDLSKFTQEFNIRSRIKDKNSDFDLCDTDWYYFKIHAETTNSRKVKGNP